MAFTAPEFTALQDNATAIRQAAWTAAVHDIQETLDKVQSEDMDSIQAAQRIAALKNQLGWTDRTFFEIATGQLQAGKFLLSEDANKGFNINQIRQLETQATPIFETEGGAKELFTEFFPAKTGGTFIDKAFDVTKDIIEDVAAPITDIAEDILAPTAEALRGVGEFAEDISEGLKPIVEAGGKIVGLPGEAFKEGADFIADNPEFLINPMLAASVKGAEELGDLVGDIFDDDDLTLPEDPLTDGDGGGDGPQGALPGIDSPEELRRRREREAARRRARGRQATVIAGRALRAPVTQRRLGG
jgi:hypothetical protein